MSAARDAAARTVVTFEDLFGVVAEFEEHGEFVSLRDASHRFWIIGGDEHGDHWATSFEHEDDDRPMPCRFDAAPIEYPAIILFTPEATS